MFRPSPASRTLTTRLAAGFFCAALTAGAAAPAALAQAERPASYSDMVLNIGSTDMDRNFVWYSDTDAAGQQVRLTSASGEQRLLAPTASGPSLDQPGLTWHHASVTGLEPGTAYTWQAGSDALGWSEAFTFTTDADAELSTLVFGDTQIGSGGGLPTDGAAWQDTLDVALGIEPDPDFLLSVGDQVNTHDSAQEYRDYLAPDQLREHALATNIGNHDDGSASDAQHSYAEHFNMPNRTGLEGWNNEMGNYWHIQEGVLFVSLNSNEQDPAKHEAWLREVIAEHGAEAEWTVAAWHHSLYSTASHATDADIEKRREWMPPLMSELGVDVVLSGHDHVYNRTHMLNNGHPVGDLSAPAEHAVFDGEVLYLTMQSSTGSKYYTIQDGIDFLFNAVQSQNRVPAFAHLTTRGDELRVTTHQVDGVVVDDVTIAPAPEGATPNPVPEGPAETVFRGAGAIDQPVPTVYDEATGLYRAEARILSGQDDVEEPAGGGDLDVTSSDLELSHESPGDDDTDPQHVGVRFDQVDIPAGAVVERAYIQFTTDEPEKSQGPLDLRIHAEADGAPARYDEFAAAPVSGRDYLEQTVAWTDAPTWDNAGEAGEAQRTPDLSALVQAVVDGEDWARHGALAFMITGEGTRTAEAYEGGGSDEAPRLMVEYSMPDGVADVRQRIADARDDVEEKSSGAMDHGSSDLEIVDENSGNPSQVVGLRYPGLQIPAGSEILSARVQFATDEDDKNTDPFDVRIRAEDVDDSAAFSDADGDLSARTVTDAVAHWTGIPAWEIEHQAGAAQRTVDLSAVVQEVVDRDGWAEGNALTLLLTGTGRRSAESADGEPALAPELSVTYRTPDGDVVEEPVEEEPTEPGNGNGNGKGHAYGPGANGKEFGQSQGNGPKAKDGKDAPGHGKGKGAEKGGKAYGHAQGNGPKR